MVMVQRFHQILIWPLELALPPRLEKLTQQPSFVRQLGLEVADSSGGVWSLLDVFDRGTTDDRDLRYAEYVYFHPFVRRVLYPSDQEPNPALSILRRLDVLGVEVELQDEPGSLTLKVDRVHLYLFRSQTALLVVEVSTQTPMALSTAEQFVDQFRRVYAPYHYMGKGGHCPTKLRWLVSSSAKSVPSDGNFDNPEAMYSPVEDPRTRRAPVAAHWSWLIEPLHYGRIAADAQICVEQLEDDRIPAMSFFGVDDPFALTRADFIRLCFCDSAGDSFELPYGQRFLEDFEKRFCYDRFWQEPDATSVGSLREYVARKNREWRFTRYVCTGYHFGTITKPDGWGLVILSHFRHHYFQIGLLATFHRASLLKYSRRLTDAATRADHRAGDERWEPLIQVRKEFADFVNQYWFREVSNQDQGKELFQWWSERLGNRELLAQLSMEASAVDRILHDVDEHDRRIAEAAQQKNIGKLQEETRDLQKSTRDLQASTDWLTKVIFWLAGLTLCVAILDADWVRKLAAGGGDWFLKRHWGTKEFIEWRPLASTTAIGLLVGFVLLKLMSWRHKTQKGDGVVTKGRGN